MENKKKGWTRDETKTFLQLCLEENVPKLLDGKKFRTSETFLMVKTTMDTLNYIRTVAQLIDKYRRLKTLYYQTKSHHNKSGADRMEFEYYEEMEKLLGKRPVSAYPSIHGFDSSDEIITVEPNIDYYEDIQYLDSSETEPFMGPLDLQSLDDEIDSSFENPKPSTSTEASTSSTRTSRKRTAGRVTYSTALNEFAEKWGDIQKNLNEDFFKKMKKLDEENAAREDHENERNEAFMMKLMSTFLTGMNKQ